MGGGPDTIQASAGGIVNNVFGDDPSAASWSDWAGLVAVWDEYRVLAMQLMFVPINKYNRASTDTIQPIIVIIDRDDATAVGSEALAMNFESHSVHCGSETWTKSVKMAGVEDAVFLTTATTVPSMWIKLYSAGNSASVVLGKIYTTALVQFCGRN